MKYYSAIKNNDTLPFVTEWTLKALCSMRFVRQRHTLYDLSYIWNLKQTDKTPKFIEKEIKLGYQSTTTG